MSEQEFSVPKGATQKEEEKQEEQPKDIGQDSTLDPVEAQKKFEDEIEIKKEDLVNFSRCIYSMKPYVEEYDMFEGNMKVTLRTRKVREIKEVNDRIEGMNVNTVAMWQLHQQRLFMAYSVKSITIEGQPVEIKGSLDDRLKFFDEMEEFVYLEICDKINYFSAKVSKIKKNLPKAGTS